MKYILRVSLFAVLLAGGVSLTASYASGQFFVFENPLVGKKAPDFTLQTTSGDTQSLHAYRQDNAAIVFFWATWCPHCRTQIKELSDRREELKAKKIELVLVDLGEKRDMVQSYLDSNDISFSVFLDQTNEVAETYEVVGVPTFYFLGGDGVVLSVEHSLPEDFEALFSGQS